jgi:hypothetical protein
MSELLNKYDGKLKALSKKDKDVYLASLLEKQDKIRERSRLAAQAKRDAGLKVFSFDLKPTDIDKFKELMQRTRFDKSELFLKMMQVYERSLQQQQQQQNPSQQNQQRR